MQNFVSSQTLNKTSVPREWLLILPVTQEELARALEDLKLQEDKIGLFLSSKGLGYHLAQNFAGNGIIVF